jgi:hypothetical protein
VADKRSVQASREADYQYWMKCGLPEEISRFIAGFPNKSDGFVERARRFYNYWLENPDTEEAIHSTWDVLRKNARLATPGMEDPESILSLFLSMPDRPNAEPFTAIYGTRNVDPDEERQRYDKQIEHVRHVKKFFYGSKELRNLLGDASATKNGLKAAVDFRSNSDQFVAIRDALTKLEVLLKEADPFAKYPTKQWASKDRGARIYTSLVADLNRYLAKPQWKALASLANINCPECPVTSDALRQSYNRKTDKTD